MCFVPLDKEQAIFCLIIDNYVDDEDANQVDVWWYDDCNDISGEEEGSKQAACHKLQISQGVRGQTVAGMYLKHVKL